MREVVRDYHLGNCLAAWRIQLGIMHMQGGREREGDGVVGNGSGGQGARRWAGSGDMTEVCFMSPPPIGRQTYFSAHRAPGFQEPSPSHHATPTVFTSQSHNSCCLPMSFCSICLTCPKRKPVPPPVPVPPPTPTIAWAQQVTANNKQCKCQCLKCQNVECSNFH